MLLNVEDLVLCSVFFPLGIKYFLLNVLKFKHKRFVALDVSNFRLLKLLVYLICLAYICFCNLEIHLFIRVMSSYMQRVSKFNCTPSCLQDETEKCEDEEEEEEDEYDETEFPGDLETMSSEALEPMETNLDSVIEERQANQQVAQDKVEVPDDDSTKKEEVSMEEEVPSEEELPDVLDDPRLVEKITKSFKRTSDDDRNACARCGLVYVVKRPKKEKQGSKVSMCFVDRSHSRILSRSFECTISHPCLGFKIVFVDKQFDPEVTSWIMLLVEVKVVRKMLKGLTEYRNFIDIVYVFVFWVIEINLRPSFFHRVHSLLRVPAASHVNLI